MWQTLVSEELTIDPAEIQRLNDILKIYEKENLRLRKDNDKKDSIIAAKDKKQVELEAAKQAVLKKLKSAEAMMKFERIAAEGLTKKVG